LVPRSTFGRLFTYARETRADALENFTTEALAAAIRDDPGPLVAVLRSMLLLSSLDEPIEVVPATQVGVPGTGILDLVIDARFRDQTTEFWVEVKVMGGESGQQLSSYRRYLNQLPIANRPHLVTLARSRLGREEDIPWIPWQSIWRAAGAASAASRYWADLRSFLEEIRMADALDSPVSAGEAASMEGAAALLGKTIRILAAVASELNARWPAFRWPTEERRIQAVLAGQFGRHRRMLIVAGEEYRAYLFVGVISIDGEAHTAVWVETRNKAIEARRRVIELADSAGLSSAWERDMGAWGGLHKAGRLVGFASHTEVVSWFVGAMQELGDAGILELIPSLGRAEAGEAGDEES
jgi:hypothetical protein